MTRSCSRSSDAQTFKEAFEAHQALLPDANSSLEGDMSKLDLNKSTDASNGQDAETAPPAQTGEGEERVAEATVAVENADKPPPSCDEAPSSSDSKQKPPTETKEEEDSK